MRTRTRAVTVMMSAVLVTALLASCDIYEAPDDCDDWRYGVIDEPDPSELPPEYDRDQYKLTSRRATHDGLDQSIQNHCGQKGAAVDLAWGVTQGRDDILIAVLDSGIEWRNASAMADLATTAHINPAEARPAGSPPDGDTNGDGVFDITDFGDIADLNGNGVADPEDLILDPTYNDGVDNDGNGYVDDISGWDFLYGDNNPLDTVEYGHGTGEAKDSVAAANGTGSVGTCPDCRHIPVRVGDSFIADGGRFAAGVLFALDSGADVVQEALGVISNPRQAQQAIDAAYRRGVVVVASMADEASEHANLPAALDHTMPVNSITEREDPIAGIVDGYLALNGCTNFGGYTWVSVSSSSCSSEATGLGAGMMGLVESAAREAGIERHPGNVGPAEGGNVLSANEAMQVVQSNADDIDFSTPTDTDPANNFDLPATAGLVENERYQTRAGWDYINGFGRFNAYESVRSVRFGLIPPEADIASPRRNAVLPASGSVSITGRVAARFAKTYDYRVEWAVGANPPAHPAADDWHVIASGAKETEPIEGTLATLDLASVAAALPGGGSGASVGDDGLPDGDRFAVRVRIVVTSADGPTEGLEGVAQKQLFVHDDPDLVDGYPRDVEGASASSPVFADLDDDGVDELVLATSDGFVHAYRSDGSELPGWPVRTEVAPWWPSRSATAQADGIAPMRSGILVGAPAIADLDGRPGSSGVKNRPEVIVTDVDGNVWAWNHRGKPVKGFRAERVEGARRSKARVNLDYSRDSIDAQDETNRTQPAFLAAAAVGNLDADPQPEIVAAALDRHVYAFNHDGTAVDGFPVLLADPAKVESVDPDTHRVQWRADSGIGQSGGMVVTPALFDFDGDGRDEIVVGAQESFEEPLDATGPATLDAILGLLGDTGNARAYMISPEGTGASNPDTNPGHPSEQAYVPGWPTAIGQLLLNLLPMIGDGIATQAAIGDVHPAEGTEIVIQSAGGPTYVLAADGTSVLGTEGGKKVTSAWAGGLLGEGNGRFGAARNTDDIIVSSAAFSGPSIGLIDGDATGDYATTTAGLTRLVDVQLADFQLPSDDAITAYSGADGDALAGFPQVTTDLAFFVSPAIADVDGDGANEVIAANGVHTVSAHSADGARPDGWAKLTGGWAVGTPSFGDLDGDGLAEMAIVRRDGVLLVWTTSQPAAELDGWVRFGRNDHNTGVFAP